MNPSAPTPDPQGSATTTMQILVADDEPPIRQFMEDLLSEAGYDVLTAANGAQALELYRQHRPPFTLTDISMPGMTGLELLRQIKAINAEAVVMLMTGAGNERFAIDALRGGAINYFNKPVDINELVNTLNRYEGLAAGYDFEHYAGDFLEGEKLTLHLGNDVMQANQAVQMIINHCRAIFPIGELFTLRFGLYEMVINAIEHGNLGITYEEKSQALEENHLAELLRKRAEDPERRQRKTHIEATITPAQFSCVITDEGEGFDHSMFSKVEDAGLLFERLGTSMHGRGILLTCLQFDQVSFNEKGNQVTIVKNTPSLPSA